MKYEILNSAVTGVKGKSLYKGQIIDESQFVSGSIDNLKSTLAIKEVANVEIVEEIEEKPSKKVKN